MVSSLPRVRHRWTHIACLTALSVALASTGAVAQPFNAPAYGGRAPGGVAPDKSAVSDVLAVQVALTRAGFSVGAIDGRDGPKTRKAVKIAGDAIATDAEVLREYVVTAEDVAGVFNSDLPKDMMALGELESVPYASPLEMIAERFRSAVSLIERLNPDATFAAGETLRVPNVEPMDVPALSHMREVPDKPAERTAAVRVSKAGRDLKVVDAKGAVLFYAPVSSGSDKDPLPLGEWKVLNVFLRPVFNYNPDLFWDADPAHAKTKVPGGPNNPVGLVWIDLDKEHYGLHGTPTPETIGVTQSHGCVRLTNWDALHLASLVKPGTPIIFEP